MERKPVDEVKEIVASAAAENAEKTAEFIKRLLQQDGKTHSQEEDESKK